MRPTDRKYMKSHEWCKVDGDIATIGITDFAVSHLSDLVFLDLPKKGATVGAGEQFGEIESVKTVSELFAPVGGEVIAVNEARRMLTNEQTLPLTKSLFDENALVFTDLTSSAVTLRSRRHPNAVRVDFPGFPCLGIWSKPAAPFVCIEPWFGHADPTGRAPGSPIETKPGIVTLQPGLSFQCEWRATVTS